MEVLLLVQFTRFCLPLSKLITAKLFLSFIPGASVFTATEDTDGQKVWIQLVYTGALTRLRTAGRPLAAAAL